MINASDITFLCLPDAAAIESAALCTNPNTKIIDASTAPRTNPDWAYGFPELDASFREKTPPEADRFRGCFLRRDLSKAAKIQESQGKIKIA